MIIEKNKKKEKRLEIDLTGPQGNAFYLLGIASSLARNMGKEDKEIQAILNGMKSGNYEHLLEVFEKKLDSYYADNSKPVNECEVTHYGFRLSTEEFCAASMG